MWMMVTIKHVSAYKKVQQMRLDLALVHFIISLH